MTREEIAEIRARAAGKFIAESGTDVSVLCDALIAEMDENAQLVCELQKADDYRAEREAEYLFKMDRLERENAELRAAKDALIEALEGFTNPEFGSGWRGVTAPSHDLFECEFCKRTNLDCTKIQHTPDCPITQAHAAIAKARQTP